jgi:hypothetical protein
MRGWKKGKRDKNSFSSAHRHHDGTGKIAAVLANQNAL